MITLIGHGYIGENISKKLRKFNWIKHNEEMPKNTTVIINAAGYTGNPNVDSCETHKQETINGNVIFPCMLENKNNQTPIIHITSGCVYTGYRDGGWKECDEPNFNFNNGSFYSGSKFLSQELLKPYLNKSYLLRIRMPFGDIHHSKNYLTKLINYKKLIDCLNSISYIEDVSNVAIYFAKNLPEPGIYNVCNKGAVTTKDVVDMMGLSKQWFTEEEFLSNTVAPRSNCTLSVEKLCKIYPIQSVRKALRKAISKLIKHPILLG